MHSVLGQNINLILVPVTTGTLQLAQVIFPLRICFPVSHK